MYYLRFFLTGWNVRGKVAFSLPSQEGKMERYRNITWLSLMLAVFLGFLLLQSCGGGRSTSTAQSHISLAVMVIVCSPAYCEMALKCSSLTSFGEDIYFNAK